MTINRLNPGGFTFNDTVWYAGGSVCVDVNCTKQKDIASMEYFNAETQKWTLDASVFPIAVAGMQCVSLETAVVCSSGPNYYVWHGPGTPWVTSKQTQDRIEMGFTAVAGRWAVFAGGEEKGKTTCSNSMDIFDSQTNTWSSKLSLSEPRKKLACGCGGDDLVACGGGFDTGHKGYSNTLDVFNLTAMSRVNVKGSLGAKRMFLGAGGAAHKIIFAGGLNAPIKADSYVVDVFDTSTLTMHANSAKLGAHRYFETSATVLDRFVFFGPGMGGKAPVATKAIDMYDTKNDYMYQAGVDPKTGLPGVNPALPMMEYMSANGAAAGSCSFWANGGARSLIYHAVSNTVEMYCVSGC